MLGQVRSNLLLRWEYLPGSIASLVWTHEQTQEASDLGVVRIDRGISPLLGSRAIDVIMLRVAQYAPL
jgi:hypothetical protein